MSCILPAKAITVQLAEMASETRSLQDSPAICGVQLAPNPCATVAQTLLSALVETHASTIRHLPKCLNLAPRPRPRPALGTLYQPRRSRIPFDVLDHFPLFRFISYPMIKRFVMPKILARTPENEIGLPGADALDSLRDHR